MRISDVEMFFNNNVDKKQLSEISFDKENNISLINSNNLCFDFDKINEEIKTSDTLYFKNGKIIFVEFKRGKIKDIDFRLKATESIISFYNYVFLNGFKDSLCFPSDLFQIYIVYDRNNCTPIREMAISSSGRKLQVEYKHFFSKYEVIDSDRFQKIFKI
ncbi:MAG: hypothetical protein O9282_08430 [Flavobacterium sp.]|jgi:hypothetical protein|uniref:hypothetical protein n=1 Tax=Flavobacterium sp. TaxID=239 RepID=UPI0022C207FD|nr:hypothetical protein [Flavobacterium sp.]MCZ8331324.1 hypothetical protein [Flavobacterium sp.]